MTTIGAFVPDLTGKVAWEWARMDCRQVGQLVLSLSLSHRGGSLSYSLIPSSVGCSSWLIMSLLQLSPELMVHILSYLDYRDLQVCRRVNQAMNKLIQSSILLQYSMQLQLCGYDDNPNCTQVIADKLRRLSQQESAWARLDFEKETTIRIPFTPSSIYDLTDGILLLGESVSGAQSGADTIRWTRLSRLVASVDAPSSNLWERIDVSAHVIDVGLSVEEHDLIVVATE